MAGKNKDFDKNVKASLSGVLLPMLNWGKSWLGCHQDGASASSPEHQQHRVHAPAHLLPLEHHIHLQSRNQSVLKH